MRQYLAAGCVLAGLAVPGAAAMAAADKPVIAPAPAWVRPVTLPPASKTDEAAVRVLLHDEQVLFKPGRRTVYSQFAVRIQTPQGLAAGNISVPWRPDSDVLTVHKLLIRRGDRVIDVLASGQTFTVVRREANLESAALDGVLTANIQPEGLEVGDVIDFTASVSSVSPMPGARVEYVGAGWNGAPIDRAHLRLKWPSDLPVRVRTTGGLPGFKNAAQGGMSSAELTVDGLAGVNPPKGAPMRFAIGRLAEATGYASWAELARTMAPLYKKASALPAQGPLQAELLRIRALSADPKVRAQAALALVQDRVRYVFRGMDGGNLVPADAETTWSRRFGDCKGKTALLLGLLHGLGVKAEPVLVNTLIGDGMDARLPMVGLFNHVLVRAEIGRRTYWMDGTRSGDRLLDNLPVPAFSWGLPLAADGAALVRIMPPPLERPTEIETIRMDATAGLAVPAPTRIELVTREDAAQACNAGLSNMPPDARDRAMRDYWKERYDFIDVQKATASFDASSGEHRLVMEGLARMDWNDGWHQTDGTDVGYKADFSRSPGTGADAPFAVNHPLYTRTTQTILLPPGSRFTLSEKPAVDQTVAGIHYRRTARIVDNIATVEKTERSVAPEFPASEAPKAQLALRALADRLVYLRQPDEYRLTPQETKIKLAATPTDAAGFLEQGNLLLDEGEYDKAFAAFDRAAALAPKNGSALAHRGLSRVWQYDLDAAARDLDAAALVNPRDPVIYRARGLLAQRRGKPEEAVAAYTRSLEIDPGSGFALGRRAQAYRAA
ncbi:MAG TPA: DUF3857 domain-containing protein, partial [Sphingomonadaceae bacterium]|nr:DUF3857 domain-containing protein [Sphingomonadaceae bacterium]